MRAVIHFLALLSGAAALTWQVVWMRQLGLVLGVGSTATATVLAVFMGGLALGSSCFGRLAGRVRRPLLLFGLLELGIAGAALALPFGWSALAALYPHAWQALGGAPLPLAAVGALGTALLLGIPTVLMGGTLPVLAGPVTRSPARVAGDVGLLYATNTLGAVLGCLASGLLLLPDLGLSATAHWAAATNAGVGLLALALGALARAPAPHDAEPTIPPERGALTTDALPPPPAATSPAGAPPASAAVPPWLVLLVLAISGACALGYEVLWSRLLVLFLHNSTYAFTVMLACFLLGIGLGSLLLARPVDRVRAPVRLLAVCQLAIGVLSLAALTLLPALAPLAEQLAADLVLDTWWKSLVVQAAVAALVLLPATLFMGLSFPAGVRLLAPGAGVARSVGALLAANTAGAIAGALLTAVLLVPTLGLAASFRLLALGNLAAALLLLVARRPPGRARRRVLLAGALVALGLVALAPGNQLLRDVQRRGLDLVFATDDAAGTVLVLARPDDPDDRILVFGDGRGSAGTRTNAVNRFYGHLPMLLHGNVRAALTLCVGAGNTLAALALHPTVRRIDAVELSRGAVEALPFFPTNQGVRGQPKVDLHVQDGRHWLLATDRQYDVIQLEPPEVHTAGVVNLYTREFYALARRRLAPGGLLCQWANVRMMPLEAQRMLVATFLEAFPDGTLWMPLRHVDYLLLVGGAGPLRVDYPALQARCTTGPVGEDLRASVGVTGAVDLLSSFKQGPKGAAAFCDGAPILTDDRTLLDFLVPRSRDANFGLMNAFSGLALDLGSSADEHREEFAAKLEAMTAGLESPLPLLRAFPDDELRESVRKQLNWRRYQTEKSFETLVGRVRAGEVGVERY